jgi:hypothetical protein
LAGDVATVIRKMSAQGRSFFSPSLFSHLSQATVARLKTTNKLLKHKAHSSKAFRGTLIAIHQGGEFGRIGDRVVSRREFFCVAKGAPMKRTLTMTLLLVFSGSC